MILKRPAHFLTAMLAVALSSCGDEVSRDERERMELAKAVRYLAERIPSDTAPDTLTVDGIRAVRVGSMIWARENLNTVAYCNGDPISEVMDTHKWRKLKSGAWCHYQNDSLYGEKYGKLYNWYAVSDPRGLCPCGWEVASDDDWQALVNHFGGKWICTTWLYELDINATNGLSMKSRSGFDALPGGFRPTPEGSQQGDDFDGLSGGVWWASTQDYWKLLDIPNGTAWGMDMNSIYSYHVNDGKFVGKSVRCVLKGHNAAERGLPY